MKSYEELKYIIQHEPKLSGRWIKARPEIIESLIRLTPKCQTDNMMERAFWIKKDMRDYNVCYCGNNITRFRSFTDGYKNHCSTKCGVNTDQCRKKKVETNIKRYGCENPQQNSDVREKTQLTNLERYGVKNPQQCKEIHDKTEATMLKRYGRTYPHWKSYKSFTFPSGKIVKLQGYENVAITKLLETFSEDDLETDCKAILYFDTVKGQQRRYYPDIRIKSMNKIIEVKSPYTLKTKYQETLDKIKAVKLLGFTAEIWVIDPKRNMTIDVIS